MVMLLDLEGNAGDELTCALITPVEKNKIANEIGAKKLHFTVILSRLFNSKMCFILFIKRFFAISTYRIVKNVSAFIL